MALQSVRAADSRSALLGAAFLMATSAIGPGFLTQTSKFTGELFSSFGFVILVSVLLDIGAQLNIWQMITVSNMRAQDLLNRVMPGTGIFLAVLVAFGGFVFNIGNIAGTGLGLNVLLGVDVKTGAALSALLAAGIFWYKEAGKLIDRFVKILGLLMLVLMLYVAVVSHPPVVQALWHTVWPEKTDLFKIITLVGGTVGGYISFAGAHRLLDAGVHGQAQLKQVNRSAVRGILITSLMRYILFLAALGVVSQGIQLTAANPAAAVFQAAAGVWGYRFFGIVMWSAAVTSVVGASYTTVSFWKTISPFVAAHERVISTVFIFLATFIFMLTGQPVQLLVLAGAVNGIILPVALALMLIAAAKPALLQPYRHPLLLQVAGWLVVLVMTYMSVVVIGQAL